MANLKNYLEHLKDEKALSEKIRDNSSAKIIKEEHYRKVKFYEKKISEVEPAVTYSGKYLSKTECEELLEEKKGSLAVLKKIASNLKFDGDLFEHKKALGQIEALEKEVEAYESLLSFYKQRGF